MPGGPEGGPGAGASATEWVERAEDVIEHPDSGLEPNRDVDELDLLVNSDQTERMAETAKERESILIDAVEFAKQRSEEEIVSRLKLNEGNAASRVIRGIKAFFAGEFADNALAEDIAFLSPEEQAKELKSAFGLLSEETERRLGKVAVKTLITGGVGAGIATILGGSLAAGGAVLASPVFLGALAGGALARGAFELWRQVNPKEREARSRIIMARANVLQKANFISAEERAINYRMAAADSEEERTEIQLHRDALKLELVRLTNFESYKMLNGDPDEERALDGLAEISGLSHDKMRLEQKREKIADWVAAGGSLLGGFLGGLTASANLGTVSPEQAKGFTADFGNSATVHDTTSHFVRHIEVADIAKMDPNFTKQLAETGGQVFQYNPGELTAELAKQVTTATLHDGSVVHVLPGLSPENFNQLLSRATEQLNQAAPAVGRAGNFLKEAIPQAAASLVNSFGRRTPAYNETVAVPVNITPPPEVVSEPVESIAPEVEPEPTAEPLPTANAETAEVKGKFSGGARRAQEILRNALPAVGAYLLGTAEFLGSLVSRPDQEEVAGDAEEPVASSTLPEGPDPAPAPLPVAPESETNKPLGNELPEIDTADVVGKAFTVSADRGRLVGNPLLETALANLLPEFTDEVRSGDFSVRITSITPKNGPTGEDNYTANVMCDFGGGKLKIATMDLRVLLQLVEASKIK